MSAGRVSAPEWFQGRKSKFYPVEELPTFSGSKGLWVENAKLTPTLTTTPGLSLKATELLPFRDLGTQKGLLKNMAQDPHSIEANI